MSSFLAIDFETASYSRDSACAVGMVLVKNGRITVEETLLICPPNRQFNFTHIHGLTWEDVRDQPTFDELWSTIEGFIMRAEYLVAHNASFDQGVLRSCCETYGIVQPHRPFVCTMRLARSQWNIYPTKLNNVCDHFGIALNHHNATSDARACAEIVLRAQEQGWRPSNSM